jgi:hypothetical protein
MRVDTKSLKDQFFSVCGPQDSLKPLATSKLKGQSASAQGISLRNSLIFGILSNSNTNVPIPLTTIKSEEKKSFYRKTVFSLSEADRSRLATLTSPPSVEEQTISFLELVNLPKTSSESRELPSPDHLKDRITWHSIKCNLDPVLDDNVVDFVSVALEVSFSYSS